MAPKLLSVCSVPGCPNLKRHRGWCDEHQRERDRQRGTPAQRGYSPQHRQWRAAILVRDPVCQDCGCAASTTAHHIRSLSLGGGWELENGLGLCKPCHDARTLRERVRWPVAS